MLIEVNHKELMDTIHSVVFPDLSKWDGQRDSIMIVGDAGEGKTQTVLDFYKRYQEDLSGMGIINAGHMDATDMAGLPFPDMKNEVARWLTFNPSLYREYEKPFLILIEELTQADDGAQKGIAPFLDRNVRGLDGNRISDQIVIVATGNLRKHKSGAQRALAHMADRFAYWCLLKGDSTGWLHWAVENDIHRYCIGYIAERPSKLNNFQDSVGYQFEGWNTGRTWENVSRILNNEALSMDLRLKHAQSKLEDETGAEFVAWCRDSGEDVPTLEDIVRDPMTAKLPSNVGTRYMLLTSLPHHTDAKTVGPVCQYVSRFKSSLGILEGELMAIFQLAMERNAVSAIHTSEYLDFAKSCDRAAA